LAREAAEESAVLLKNADGILPLKPAQRIALIGAMADKPRYQGAGSSHINPARLVSAREAMPSASFAPGCNTDGSTSDSLLAEAAELAANADIAIVFAGLTDSYESEGFDREDLQMPDGHLKMIDAVCEANENTVVVLCCGGVVACPWADRVKGILYMGLGGQASGEAVWDLLTGKRNPSGKLAETWVNSYEDCPTSVYYRGEKDPQYRECIYVGYRYYDKANVSVRWPFGYGLSYTRFQYSDLKIEGMTVTCTVRNIGECAGKEVVQLYVSAPQQGLHRPVRELKRFAKILLQPGEAREISFQLDDRAFSLWNDGWKIPAGEYTVNICSDSRTVELQQSIWVNGEEIPAPNWQENSWYQHLIGSPDEHSWRSVYGTKTQPLNRTKGQFTMDDTVLELKDHALVMKFLYKCVELVISRPFGYKKDYSNPEFRMLMASSTDSPLSNIQICGGIRGGLMKGLLHIANGHSFRGLLTILGIKK